MNGFDSAVAMAVLTVGAMRNAMSQEIIMCHSTGGRVLGQSSPKDAERISLDYIRQFLPAGFTGVFFGI
jgi:hypothetical protein